MNYILSNPEDTVTQLSSRINQSLSEGSVLLLVSGGSNIKLEVSIINQLQHHDRLTIGLIDERYGPVRHADSNWQQLLDAGLAQTQATHLPVLTGETLDLTVQAYAAQLTRAFQEHDSVIGIFGMGPDGHTSGVLPGSAAAGATDLVVGYHGPDFERITTTPISFGLFDQAYLVAFGANKHQPLNNLQLDLPITEQPVQALKNAQELTIFNDQIGEQETGAAL